MTVSAPRRPLVSDTYLPALTGVRALAAYLVYLHHLNPFNKVRWGHWPYQFSQEFHIGVTVFFVLSGFLITLRYEARAQATWRWAGTYFFNRFARIYPVYFLLTALTFAVFLVRPAYDELQKFMPFEPVTRWYVAGLNFTFLRGFFDGLKFSGVAQGWSLTIEECFYLSVPLVFLARGRFVFKALLYTLGASVTGLLLLHNAYGPGAFGFFATPTFLYNYTFFGRVFEFVAGMALAYYFKTNPVVAPRTYWTVAGAVGMVAVVAGLVYVRGNHLFGIETPAGMALNNLVLPLTICAFFFGLIHENTLFRRLLETRLFQLLGKSSYAFYLVHIGVVEFFLARHLPQSQWLRFGLTNLGREDNKKFNVILPYTATFLCTDTKFLMPLGGWSPRTCPARPRTAA